MRIRKTLTVLQLIVLLCFMHMCIYRVRQQKPDAQNFNSKETFKEQF